MGVPGFYRWAVRRVPNLRQRTSSPPYEFDNVYLDFNGVVHGCIGEWALQTLEDVLFELIEEHLAMLLSIVHPKVLLYIALDGVAPRAKMNQQRSRRFRAGRQAEADAETMDGVLETFDKNAVTPGTPFMVRLGRRLRAWAEANAATDALRGVAIVVSSDLEPGEGEHKIMEVIRHHPERTHCLYSNDADLVFLGLVSNAPDVYLLRSRGQGRSSGSNAAPRASSSPNLEEPEAMVAAEATEVVGGVDVEVEQEVASPAVAQSPAAAPSPGTTPQSGQDDYELLSIVALRSWLASQFPDCEPRRLAADFVALCCLAGNDFLPHVEAVDIYAGGLDTLLEAYRDISPGQDGHLVSEDLTLALPRWRPFLEKLAPLEAEALLQGVGLGLGAGSPAYRGPGPPDSRWDGLSVLASWLPPRATAADVRAAMSKKGCAVRSVHAVRPNRRCGSAWLIRFDDPDSAVRTLVSTRVVWGRKVVLSWVDTSRLDLLELPTEPFEAADWRPALTELVVDTFEFWLGPDNLPRDAFLRRHVRIREDRFVPLKVFGTFNRLRMLCQDLTEIARMLRTSSKLEVIGEGEDAAVRAVQDCSIREDETPEQVARQQDAAARFAAGDFVGSARALRQDYYARHAGPVAGDDAPPLHDVAGTERQRSRAFLSGIEWVLKYYVRACSSWSWFFPAHYPPLLAGLLEHSTEALDVPPLSAPFAPELQLLAVLPPQSAALLPAELQPLLLDPASPLADFYPRDFGVDHREGEPDWHATVLLPFVDEQRLRDALASLGWNSTTAFEPARGFLAPEAASYGLRPSVGTWMAWLAWLAEGSRAEAAEPAAAAWDFNPRGRLPRGRRCRHPRDAERERDATRKEVRPLSAANGARPRWSRPSARRPWKPVERGTGAEGAQELANAVASPAAQDC